MVGDPRTRIKDNGNGSPGAMRRTINRFAVVALLLLAACEATPTPTFSVLQTPEHPYDFPWIDPYTATVVRTPPILRVQLPEKISIDELELTVIPGRQVPDLFWYNSKLKFSLVHQKKRAPLIFIIAGTGSPHDGASMKMMQRAFFDAGLHVISLPSPTHPNFIVNASSTSVPGRVSQDAKDLYRTMQLAYEQVSDRIEVSDFYLTGYSLGGWQAAYVAQLDEEEGALGFGKVLMINPPVSLYSSIGVLDSMLEDNLPGGIDDVGTFVDEVFEAFAETSYEKNQAVVFSDDLLYSVYVKEVPSQERVKALIGLVFRFVSNDMAFTADVMTDYGYVVPEGWTPDTFSSLTKFFQTSMRLTFEDYLDEFLYPYYRELDPDLTKQDIIDESSLVSIEDYLAGADKIGLMTNEDDIILAEGEIDYLRKLFGPRGKIFPTGGHLGNLDDRNHVHAMVSFFKQ